MHDLAIRDRGVFRARPARRLRPAAGRRLDAPLGTDRRPQLLGLRQRFHSTSEPRKEPTPAGLPVSSFVPSLASEPNQTSIPTPARVAPPLAVSTRVPTTLFLSIVHIERSPQRIPIPSAFSTWLCSTSPIDISVIEIPRSVVASTWLCLSIAIEEWVTIPSWPPVTLQPSTMVMPRSEL